MSPHQHASAVRGAERLRGSRLGPQALDGLVRPEAYAYGPTQVSAEGSYLVNMLPALLLMSVGLGMVFVPMQNLALFGVDKDDAGVASASQQIGGSLGIALFSTIAAAATAGATSLAALSAGYSMVFLWAAGVAILITPIALLMFTGTDSDAPLVHLG